MNRGLHENSRAVEMEQNRSAKRLVQAKRASASRFVCQEFLRDKSGLTSVRCGAAYAQRILHELHVRVADHTGSFHCTAKILGLHEAPRAIYAFPVGHHGNV